MLKKTPNPLVSALDSNPERIVSESKDLNINKDKADDVSSNPESKKMPDLIDTIIQKWQQTDLPATNYIGTEIIGRIVRLNAFIQLQSEQNFSKYDLSIGDFDLLAVLRRETSKQLTPRKIQELIIVSSGGLSNRMTRLEAKNLIARIPDPNDRRGVIVMLTAQGKALIDKVAPTHLALENELVASLSYEEQAQLSTLLKKVLLPIETEN